MYSPLDNHEFGEPELTLRCPVGIPAFAFTRPVLVDRFASTLQVSAVSQR